MIATMRRNQPNLDLVRRIRVELERRYKRAMGQMVRYGTSKEDPNELLALLQQYDRALLQWTDHAHVPPDSEEEEPEQEAELSYHFPFVA